ncbi:germin-like protein 9-3 [Andrographis paniculata]|uniref:germin-like protein 9-3 n=1 Tax=Andrographis paniculata TaxID=175694 RepID=UPI0021E9229F|nr:germin-like protein 9-3 [Andrographis paniculata]
MATVVLVNVVLLLTILVHHHNQVQVSASDPDILTDFVVPVPPNTNGTVDVDGSYFTYTGLRSFIGAFPPKFTIFKASVTQLPALEGQSVSYAALVYPPGGSVNPPHTHPRASELLFLLVGSLEVGFVDTGNQLFAQTLQQGDMFVFPKGLVHYQYNKDGKNPAVALSAFGSASPGTVAVPSAVFNASIDESILAASFKTDVGTIKKLEAGLSH